ncbi:phage tail sheath C-terminal domain-containing protein [Marinibactrum halimedae]|uniref:Phage tail protein n=1 Tax=Marinibactrum halimedae TaxID=1444977 RepID=A0AA37T803_9GAMM|nr:phage tail sheath C-terminal domain-containing protein [Marinibactrum halimedae]MCD9460782.1 phage tail sheath subtilisin-like domain-containing protein [Marinibactrum halimedae]GLS27369.1 hypothetical protein GCM10007877_30880 [Marinibactrum halimedae]
MSFLHGVEVVELNGGARPVSSVTSSVIGLVGTAKKGPTNKPILISGSRKEAIDQFGTPDGVSTIPDALNAIFDQAGAMVVVVNVQPKDRKVAKDFTLEKGAVELGHFYTSDLVVKSKKQIGANTSTNDSLAGVDTEVDSTDAGIVDTAGDITATELTVNAEEVVYQENIDYIIASKAGPNGLDLLTITANSRITDTETLSIAYSVASEKLADKTALLSVDNADGGILSLVGSESKLKVTPRILIAPGFTDDETVVNKLISVAERLRAIVVADGPDSDDSQSIEYREKFDSARLFLVDPKVVVFDSVSNSEVLQPASSRVAGIIAKSDNERGFWWSPSNRPMLGITGTSRAIDFTLGDKLARANLLNENEVATIVHQNGYRLWGNRSCSSDPKFAFISVRRTADIINDSLLRAHLRAVDRNITKTYVEEVTESVNNFLRQLKAVGAIINGECWADPDLNTPDQIAQGKVFFDFDFTPPFPAEHITFRSRLTNDYLEEIFA